MQNRDKYIIVMTLVILGSLAIGSKTTEGATLAFNTIWINLNNINTTDMVLSGSLNFTDPTMASCTALETVAGKVTCGNDDTGVGGGGAWNITSATTIITSSPNAINFSNGFTVTNTTLNVARIQIGGLSLPAGNVTNIAVSGISQANLTGITISIANTTGNLDWSRVANATITNLPQANLSGITLPNGNVTGVWNWSTIANWTGSANVPLGNLTGSTSTQCGGTDQRAYNVTLTNGVLSITCGTDATGGAGSYSFGRDMLYNITTDMYLNYTKLKVNLSADYWMLNGISTTANNISGLTNGLTLAQANISTGITLPNGNVTGLWNWSTIANWTGSANIPQGNLTGIWLTLANITAATFNSSWTWNGAVIASTYLGSHVVAQANITGITLPVANLSGTLISSQLGSHTTDQANITGLTIPIANVTAGTAPGLIYNIPTVNATTLMNASAIALDHGNLSMYSQTNNNTYILLYDGTGTCKGKIGWNGTGIIINASGC